MSLAQRTSHERLVRVCLSDYDRQIALVACERRDDGCERIFAVGRLTRVPATQDAEFAIVVGDQWQHHGLGTLLLKAIINTARSEGIARIVGDMLPQNTPMKRICQKLGFSIKAVPGDRLDRAELQL